MPHPKKWALALAATVVCGLVALPSAVAAYRLRADANLRSTLEDFVVDADPRTREEQYQALSSRMVEPPGDDEAETDDPRRRMLMRKVLWGAPSALHPRRMAEIAAAEAERWAPLLPRLQRTSSYELNARGAVSGGGQSWVNLGPTDAQFQWNGTPYYEVDSGRAAGILMDPRDAQVVYFATSGGGIWKTWDFGVTNPTWYPITETLGNIAVGALDMDPLAPDTLHVGIGDAFDLPGGYMVKTTNGGASWEAPVPLTAAYPAAAGGLTEPAGDVREVRVDPGNPSRIFVTTNVGLFRSEDGGSSYVHLDLPNSNGARAEATWSVAYAGSSASGSRFVVSGVYACAAGEAPLPPGYGVTAGGTNYLTGGTCTGGTLGDIWYTANSGATWTSLRTAGGLVSTNIGRVTLAAGTAKANAATTVLYAQVSQTAEATGSAGNGIWRSGTGGASFVSANGSLSNATRVSFGSRDCGDVNVNAGQAWYNSTLAVDPGNDANVLVGGMLCGLRTVSGTAGTPTWENVAHWLPSGGGGDTNAGTLPYVHADWHRARIVRVGATVRAFAGTDGGIFFSDNLFAGATPPNVVWGFPNRGIVTHLAYSVASGDPADGNAQVAYFGLQDNGTRFRDTGAPTTFNQVIGGDGIGATVARSSASAATTYWASVNGRQARCVPSSGNNFCNQGGAWATASPTVLGCGSDASPFFVRFASSPASSAGPTALTLTDRGIFKNTGTAGSWAALNTCLTSVKDGVTTTHYLRFVSASEKIDGLYGVALSGGRFAVNSSCPGSTTACSGGWTVSSRISFDLNNNGTEEDDEWLQYTSSVAFPPGATGRPNGDEYVAASAAPETMTGAAVDPRIGHVFRTTNRGASWTAINGHGGSSPLPLVPVNVVRYDPGDLTNQTLYVGTDLGVYRTIDGGATWHRYGVGLPLVKVTDLFVGRNGQIIRVGTYGRGVWEIYPSATAERGISGNGDFDRDLQIDIVDLAAAASRLGTDTRTTTQPYYDWNMDLVAAPSNGNAIEEADLSGVLSKFGGRP